MARRKKEPPAGHIIGRWVSQAIYWDRGTSRFTVPAFRDADNTVPLLSGENIGDYASSLDTQLITHVTKRALSRQDFRDLQQLNPLLWRELLPRFQKELVGLGF